MEKTLDVTERIKISYQLIKEYQKKYGFTYHIIEHFNKHVCGTYYKTKNKLTLSGAMLRYPDYLSHSLKILLEEEQ